MNNTLDKWIIADSDCREIYRFGLAELLKRDFSSIPIEIAEYKQLPSIILNGKPTLLLITVDFGSPAEVGVLEILKGLIANIPTVVITIGKSNEDIIRMLSLGVKWIVDYNSPFQDIKNAIRAFQYDQNFLCKRTVDKIAQFYKKAKVENNLNDHPEIIFSDLELQIMKLICKEYSAKEISQKLNYSFRTIEGYRLKLLEKTNSKNFAGIIVFAIKMGIFDPLTN